MVRALARDHVNAVLALLTAAGVTNYLSERSATATQPCVVVHPSGGVGLGGPISDPSTGFQIDFQITAIGDDAEQALWMSDKACSAINRAQPSISGRTPWPIWADEQPAPVRRDDGIDPPLFIATTRWSLHTEPA